MGLNDGIYTELGGKQSRRKEQVFPLQPGDVACGSDYAQSPESGTIRQAKCVLHLKEVSFHSVSHLSDFSEV